MECVKRMPLNPAETARGDRNARWGLRVFHSSTGSLPKVVMTLTVIAGSTVLCLGAVCRVVVTGGAPERVNPFLALGLSVTAVGEWMIRTHSRLGPWCPDCDDGGDEDDEETPVEDPTGGRDRPLAA
ncbi:hypothetical protein [Streptomyces sp. NPDC057939]|uniref:hypothetical protein n=1 Tax=Streptomyces sp. NPDC057939 TaxID=3346284 RepID=UPI0036E4F0BE